MITIQLDGKTVSYNDSQETKDKIFKTLLDWFNKHEAYCGETIWQSDVCAETANELLTEICEKGFQFDVKWED